MPCLWFPVLVSLQSSERTDPRWGVIGLGPHPLALSFCAQGRTALPHPPEVSYGHLAYPGWRKVSGSHAGHSSVEGLGASTCSFASALVPGKGPDIG